MLVPELLAQETPRCPVVALVSASRVVVLLVVVLVTVEMPRASWDRAPTPHVEVASYSRALGPFEQQQQQCFAAAVAALLRLILPDGTASVAVELGWKLAQVTTQKNRRQLLQSRATSRAR